MAGDSTDSANSKENPGDAEASGSESKEKSDEGRTFTEAEYKGLQRSLTKAQGETEAAQRSGDAQKAEVERLQGQTENGTLTTEQLAALVTPVLTQMREKDPEGAQRLAGQIRQTLDTQKLAKLETGAADRKADAEAEAAEVTNMDSLRGIAEALGADPDDSSINYGDPSQWLASRITTVRQTARALADKGEKTTEPPPSVSEGTAHSSNPGIIENARTETPDEAQLQVKFDKLIAEYTARPHPKKLEAMREARDALMIAQGQGEIEPPAEMVTAIR